MILKLMKRYEKIQQWANNGHFKYQRKKQNPQTQSTKGFAGNVTGDPYGNRTHDSTVKGWRLSRLTNGPERSDLSELLLRPEPW